MDILSETLAAIRTGNPTSGMFVRHAPWGRAYPEVPGAGFHVVVQGSCWLVPPDDAPIALGEGDVVFMPRGRAHTLVDQLDSAVTEAAHPGEPREIDGPGARSALLCGAYALGRGRTHPMFDELPDFIHLPAQSGRRNGLRAIVELLVDELTEPKLGTSSAIPALLEPLLLYLLRTWFSSRESGRWATAFTDPTVSAALSAIHADPAAEWSVDELSSRAGVSRATLARKFAATVGEPPLAYVTRWRMLTAARMLREDSLPLASVGRKVGYASEFAFAKAFKRAYGVAPGRYRREGELPAVAVS
ncbi:AraC family transcriptional regulator [Nocardia camponoti]|uniref:AraC family transcriptional regulator n=1 Tax=Nocardia camponoti TaxID=1616106 RepID=UPI00166AB9FD|nr:AraC family transcriptional regulator [Nocardia camponoti]